MPKTVDHAQRRREIAEAVSRIAIDRGLQGVSFREVAAEADMSVSLIQHYFGSKENLLIGTLGIQSARMAELIASRLDDLDPEGGPAERLRTIAMSFIPADEASTSAMLLYHAFAAAALTDRGLRRADAFADAGALTTTLRDALIAAQESGRHRPDHDPETEAQTILSLVLGLSLGVLLEQTTADEASSVLDSHLEQLKTPRAEKR